VLVNVEGHVQISDFGQAIVVGNMTATSTGAGTKYFMSPERFAQEQRMPSDDVFAFAGIAYVVSVFQNSRSQPR
jgi:serine/threonine protein kinase